MSTKHRPATRAKRAQVRQTDAKPTPAKPAGNVGLRQVAKAAGVSTATVSRAINKPEVVSQELRERIASVVERLGWVPDGAARALATRRSGVFGAVFPTLTHGDFARAAHAIQDELLKRGYTLLLACSEYDPEQELQQARKFVERGVDALILVGQSHHADLAAFLERQRVPTINTFVYDQAAHGTCVGPDNRKALYRLTKYLIEFGHTDFATIAQSTESNDRALARLEGTKDALAERGYAIRPQHMLFGRWSIDEGRKLCRQLMTTSPRPTAIVCGNPYLTIGAVLEAQEMGLRVPDDVSIVGYDDIEIMAQIAPPITTIRVQSDLVGRFAVAHLIARLEGRDAPVPFECDAEIVVRKSAGPAPRSAARRR